MLSGEEYGLWNCKTWEWTLTCLLLASGFGHVTLLLWARVFSASLDATTSEDGYEGEIK